MSDLNVLNLRINAGPTEVVRDVSFDLPAGQRLGIIGESGSGKSLTALAIMGLLDSGLKSAGSITLGDKELIGLRDRQMRALRGKRVAMVFQEPMNALDPLMKVGKQLGFAAESPSQVPGLLESVSLDASLANRFPHELSGGQRQRVMIAMAMASNPDVLICDEPTTALDATTESGILDVIDRVTTANGTSLLFITHDLSVMARICPTVLVMKDGAVVETGSTQDVLSNPQEDYTAALVAASLPGAPAPARPTGQPAIVVDNATRSFGAVTALKDFSLTVPTGQRLGIVGGSGSGKTTLLNLIAGLNSPSTGSVEVSGRAQMVFQDPQGSLNPRMQVGNIIAEGLPRGHGLSKKHIADKVHQALTDVGIDPSASRRYPHEFSGGQRQRISIARAIIGNPDILLADEAVSALDVSVRAQVLQLLEELVDGYGLTLVFVSHDLPVVRQLCDTLVVLHHGEVVEAGPTEQLWTNPQHAYTRELLTAAQ